MSVWATGHVTCSVTRPDVRVLPVTFDGFSVGLEIVVKARGGVKCSFKLSMGCTSSSLQSVLVACLLANANVPRSLRFVSICLP